ncbi:MAG: hypothetical protein LAP13_23785 [Acidobacteriia bacterium]|nr:hypothetical protein [Terriglobia bacterium]
MKGNKGRSRFMLCIRNDGAEDLETRKVYQVLLDRKAASEGYARIIDESGEDYLYPVDYFVPLKLPATIACELALPAKGFSKLRAASQR